MSQREVFNPNWPRLKNRSPTFNLAVKKGSLLFLSGVGPVDPVSGKIVGVDDIEAQTRMVYENIKDMLASAGATFDDVVKTTEYITPAALPNYKATADIRREYFKKDFPAATGVIVSSLVRPDMLIEIDAIAVLDA